jgi:hypothetical protein
VTTRTTNRARCGFLSEILAAHLGHLEHARRSQFDRSPLVVYRSL